MAIQICVFTAFGVVPKNALMRRCCLIHLKNSCRVRNWRGAGPCGWARLQFLPIRTTREVFPQAAHPTRFCGRVMCRLGHGGHFHARSIATVLSTQMLPHGEEIIEIAKGSDADQWDRGADRIVPTGTSLPPFVRLGQKRPMHSAPVPNNVRFAPIATIQGTSPN